MLYCINRIVLRKVGYLAQAHLAPLLVGREQGGVVLLHKIRMPPEVRLIRIED